MRTSSSRLIEREKAAAAYVRRDFARRSSLAFLPRGLHRIEVGSCFREEKGSASDFASYIAISSSAVASHLRSPNKAPEPTSWAVTHRADARCAPAHAVAHL